MCLKFKQVGKFFCVFMLMGFLLAGCGSVSEMDNTDSGETNPPSPSISYSGADTPPHGFRAGGSLTFSIDHTGDCVYKFDLINLHTQKPIAFLAHGKGDFKGSIVIIVPQDDYVLSVESGCSWKVDIFGNAVKLDTGNSGNDDTGQDTTV